MKRLSLFFLVVVLIATLGYRPAPTRAASPSLADFFPDKTLVYGEMDTSNLPATVTTLSDLLSQMVPNIPANWQTLIVNMWEQQFKRKVDFNADLIGWIGDRAAFGIYAPDETFNLQMMNSGKAPSAQFGALITVKDEAKADAFLKDLETAGPKPESTTETLNDNTVTIYGTMKDSQVARWKGYIALGNVRLILDGIKNKVKPLSGNALYQKMIGTLKPGTMGSVFVRTPVAASSVGFNFVELGLLGPTIGNIFNNIVSQLNGTPTPTPSPTPPPSADEQRVIDAFLALGGSIYSVRAEGKALILDVTSSYDDAALKQLGDILKMDLGPVIAEPNPVSGTLLDAIPADASAVIIGSDLPQIYNQSLTMLAAVAKAQGILTRKPLDSDPSQLAEAQVELGVRAALGLDWKADVLAWAGGDYALYVNDDKGGLLDTMTNHQLPVAETILISSSDPAKSKTFVDALIKAANAQLKTTSGAPDADGLTSLTVSPGAVIKLGALGDRVVLTTAQKFAVKAASGLATAPAWQNAAKLIPETYSQLFYADAGRLSALLAGLNTKNMGTASIAQIQQYQMLLKPFESALVVYTAQGAGQGTSTFILFQK